MYHGKYDQTRFAAAARESALASSMLARAAWERVHADGQRLIHRGDETADQRIHAMRERFRVAHRETVALKDEMAECDETDGDLDEYGYAA